MPMIYPHKIEMPTADPKERRSSWDEVALGYTVEQAVFEARRCLQCQDPVCEQGCPVNVPIRDFVRAVSLRPLRRGGANDPAEEHPAGRLRPRVPGRASVRAPLRAAR